MGLSGDSQTSSVADVPIYRIMGLNDESIAGR